MTTPEIRPQAQNNATDALYDYKAAKASCAILVMITLVALGALWGAGAIVHIQANSSFLMGAIPASACMLLPVGLVGKRAIDIYKKNKEIILLAAKLQNPKTPEEEKKLIGLKLQLLNPETSKKEKEIINLKLESLNSHTSPLRKALITLKLLQMQNYPELTANEISFLQLILSPSDSSDFRMEILPPLEELANQQEQTLERGKELHESDSYRMDIRFINTDNIENCINKCTTEEEKKLVYYLASQAMPVYFNSRLIHCLNKVNAYPIINVAPYGNLKEGSEQDTIIINKVSPTQYTIQVSSCISLTHLHPMYGSKINIIEKIPLKAIFDLSYSASLRKWEMSNIILTVCDSETPLVAQSPDSIEKKAKKLADIAINTAMADFKRRANQPEEEVNGPGAGAGSQDEDTGAGVGVGPTDTGDAIAAY